ncbi:MAG: YibE/F family protein [Elusimicrobiota bacterium]|nr:YibE/F family protein [Elusimicrobiota bacterium]
MNKKKTIILLTLVFLFPVPSIFAEHFYEDPTIDLHAHPLQAIKKSTRSYARAEIDEVIRPATRREAGLVRVTVTSGKHARDVVFAKNAFYHTVLNPGDNIVISYDDSKEGPENILVDGYDRTGQVVLLLMIFTAVALLVGRRKIIFPFMALVAGLLIIKIFFIPAVTAGRSPVVYSLVTVAGMVIITMFSIDKFKQKSVTAIIGAFSGLAALASLALLFYSLSDITGLYNDNIQLLQFLDSPLAAKGPRYFGQIMIAVAVLGSSGIIMDVAISISSALKEIAAVSKKVRFSGLLTAARQVASDITATMINTLIFAYIGASLGALLVRGLHIRSLRQLLNAPFFHVEFYQVIIGGAGFLICAIVTAIAGSWLFSRRLSGTLDKQNS